jgi:hypothetical protein
MGDDIVNGCTPLADSYRCVRRDQSLTRLGSVYERRGPFKAGEMQYARVDQGGMGMCANTTLLMQYVEMSIPLSNHQ